MKDWHPAWAIEWQTRWLPLKPELLHDVWIGYLSDPALLVEVRSAWYPEFRALLSGYPDLMQRYIPLGGVRSREDCVVLDQVLGALQVHRHLLGARK